MDRDDKESKEIYLELLNKISRQVEGTQAQMRETTECMNKLDKSLAVHIAKTDAELKAINKLDQEQNEELRTHIEGVRTLKAMHREMRDHFEARMERLEAPRKALVLLRNWVIGVGSLAGAVFAVGKLLGWF